MEIGRNGSKDRSGSFFEVTAAEGTSGVAPKTSCDISIDMLGIFFILNQHSLSYLTLCLRFCILFLNCVNFCPHDT